MVAFFRRTTPWWYALSSEMDRPAAKAGEAACWESLGRLQAQALGTRAVDMAAQQVLGGVLHPATVGALLWALEQSGMAPAAADRVEDLIVGFLRLRHGETASDAADRLILSVERSRGGTSS